MKTITVFVTILAISTCYHAKESMPGPCKRPGSWSGIGIGSGANSYGSWNKGSKVSNSYGFKVKSSLGR